MKLKRDDKVRLTDDCPQLHLPESMTPKKGEIGRITKLYRVQDGLEIYQVVLDGPGYKFLAAPHTKLEKIEAPKSDDF
jgi:hypothetical protein